MKRTTWCVLVVWIVACLGAVAVAGDEADSKSIEQAVTNYVTSIYEMKPELVDESVHPKLQKLGYMPADDGSGWNESWMNHAELRDLAATLNKDKMFDPETAPLEIEIVDHTALIASVKLTAAWGIDYIHLVNVDGKWMIVNVVWQMAAHE